MAGAKGQTRRFRVWPGVAAPLGLTLLATIAVWLFQAKVSADQAERDAINARRETNSRHEAGEIVRHSQALAATFVEARRTARKTQEKSLTLEARGVLDAIYRHLTVSLDSVRKNATARREVRPFPPGFDGIRVFLEIVPAPDEQDDALEALRASHTELAALLPAGCSLAVVEDNSRQLFSLGGGVPPENAVTASVTREFLFNAGGRSRLWSLRLDIVSPDTRPQPDTVSTAEYIAENLRTVRLDDVAWQGWLLGRNGMVEAAFGPDTGPGGSAQELPPYIDVAGEWVDVDGKRLVWLEKSGLKPNLDWETAVAIAMPRPGLPLDLVEEFMADSRWSLTIGLLIVLTLTGWVWFVRSMFAARLAARALALAASEPAPPSPPEPAVQMLEQARKRLVRDERPGRAVLEKRDVIVADIGDDGRVRVEEARVNPPRYGFIKPEMLSGSLSRLQAMHRGKESAFGSRVLDQAKSPVLRELIKRVRPAEPAAPVRQRPVSAKTEIIPSMKSPTGWKKINHDGK